MNCVTRRPQLVHFFVLALAGAALGACLGIAQAQDQSTGQLDVDCSNSCTAHGYDAEFCGQACWIPDPEMVAKGEGLDWKCLTSCRDRGGKLSDCLPRCKLR
jgi:hypothetical protein